MPGASSNPVEGGVQGEGRHAEQALADDILSFLCALWAGEVWSCLRLYVQDYKRTLCKSPALER